LPLYFYQTCRVQKNLQFQVVVLYFNVIAMLSDFIKCCESASFIITLFCFFYLMLILIMLQSQPLLSFIDPMSSSYRRFYNSKMQK